MAALDVIRTLTLRARAEGFQQATQNVAALGEQYDTSARRALSQERSLLNLERRFVTTARETQDYERVQRQLNLITAQFPDLQGRANAVLDAASTKLGVMQSATTQVGASFSRMNSQLANTQNNVQATITNFGALGTGLTNVQVGSTTATARLASFSNQLSVVQNGATTVAATLGQIGNQFNALTARAGAPLPTAVANLTQFGNQSKAARYELINLSRQIQDVGVGLASGQSPLTVLIQQGSQIADVFASSQLTVAQWGAKFLSFINPVTLAVGGLIIAIGGLTAAYLALNNTGRFSVQVLEDQKKLLSQISEAFSQAARGATAFLDANNAIFQLKLREQLIDLTKQLQTFRVETQKTVVTPTAVPSEIPGVPGIPQIEDAQRVKQAFDEINNAIRRFNASARDATDVIALRKEIAEIGANAAKTNPALADSATEFLKNTEAAGNAAEAIRLIRLQVRALLGDLEAMKQLGFPLPVNEMEKFIQRTKDNIAVRREEAASVGKSAAETAKLKIQLEAERISREKGIPIDQKRLDALKTEAGAAEDALKAGKDAFELGQKQLELRKELAREAQTAFFTSEDAAIAERLKDLYPDVQQAIKSVEADQIRFNNRLKEVNQLINGAIEHSLVSGFSDIIDGTKSVSVAFQDMSKSIIRAIEEMIVKMFIVQPILKGLQTSLQGAGLLSFLAPAGATVPAPHAGGIVGQTWFPTRTVEPPLTAPRLHNGLRSDEMFAILQRGERVVPKGSGSGVVVQVTNQVINNASNIVSTRTTSEDDGRGGRKNTIVIDEMVSSAIGRTGSRSSMAAQNAGRLARR